MNHSRASAPASPRAGRAPARRARAGLTSIELMISMVVMTVCVSLLSNTISATIAHTAAKRERALAVEGAMNALEDMRRRPFAQLFALYNADPTDDPDPRAPGPGQHFAVPGLEPQAGDADGFVGRVILPATRAPLRENAAQPALGLPRDLNGDHRIDELDHASDYVVLPVQVVVEWHGRQGNRRFALSTMLADIARVGGS